MNKFEAHILVGDDDEGIRDRIIVTQVNSALLKKTSKNFRTLIK